MESWRLVRKADAAASRTSPYIPACASRTHPFAAPSGFVIKCIVRANDTPSGELGSPRRH